MMASRLTAVTRAHARERHGLVGDDWTAQHHRDHVLADRSSGPGWAHRHDPEALSLSHDHDTEVRACRNCGELILLAEDGWEHAEGSVACDPDSLHELPQGQYAGTWAEP